MAEQQKEAMNMECHNLDLPREGRCRPAQVARMMSVCRATLYNRIRDGKLPPLRKDGERVSFWYVEEIRPYLRPPETIGGQD